MSLLYALLIGPIEFIIEFVFAIIYRFSENPGISIIGVSLIVQLLVLPLYKRSDAIQEEERNKQKSMEKWVNQIKRCYHGDKRVMVLSAYYREQNYKPIYALRGAISLLLQIPFFMAAYNYLSKLKLLEGVSFFCFSNLAKPDALISFAGVTINVLPVVMTLVNIVSGAIYTRGFKLKEKLQLYIMALVFLVLLYNSPSGLVLYWTMNNVFSLGKNLFALVTRKWRNAGQWLCLVTGISILIIGVTKGYAENLKKTVFFIAVAVISSVPLFLSVVKKNANRIDILPDRRKISKKIFYLSVVSLTIFIGLVIPSAVIKSSPDEFGAGGMTVWAIMATTFCLFAGLFLIWSNIYYIFAGDKSKGSFSFLVFVILLVGTVNFLFFGKNFGILSYNLVFDKPLSIAHKEIAINIVVDFFVFIVCWLLFFKFKHIVHKLSIILLISIIALSFVNIGSIFIKNKKSQKFRDDSTVNSMDELPEDGKILCLSKKGRNVIVFFLDRALGFAVPFELDLYPQLRDLLDGFTYYPNTISFAGGTVKGSPALFGGYEYTPEAINDRENESLKEKHNQALLLMPLLFSKNGYNVDVFDPPLANYVWTSDLSMYDEYPDISVRRIERMFVKDYEKEYPVSNKRSFIHNFFWYSIMKMCPLCMYDPIYDDGYYTSTDSDFLDSGFIDDYSGLLNLEKITGVAEDCSNAFFLMYSCVTHDGGIAEASGVIPTRYSEVPMVDVPSGVVESSDGYVLDVSDYSSKMHLRTNLAALIAIGEYCQWLKDNDVFDNTKIIIVSDHGWEMNCSKLSSLATRFNPLLMVKDFDAHGFKIDDEFMTNADVPTIAFSDAIDNPVNPFTGRPIDSQVKSGIQMILDDSDSELRTGNFFVSAGGCNWWNVKENIFVPENWKLIRTEP
ncbi:MAG: YidC/Oxa1 family membrane protein insertase [Sphaerochaetaceae bacterium]|nr:YidC/Oxa1 family membrane protein insertase [Sphaerochaetaceae bacterium]